MSLCDAIPTVDTAQLSVTVRQFARRTPRNSWRFQDVSSRRHCVARLESSWMTWRCSADIHPRKPPPGARATRRREHLLFRNSISEQTRGKLVAIMSFSCACGPCRWDSHSPVICVAITYREANTCSHEVPVPLSQRAEKLETPYPPDTARRSPRATACRTGTRMTKFVKRCPMGLTAQASERIIQRRCEGKSRARA